MAIMTEADERLRGWLAPIVGDATLHAGPPPDDTDGDVVTAFLLSLEPTTTIARDPHQPSIQVVRLRYLVCADAADPARSLDLLDAIVTALLDAPVLDDGTRLELDLAPVTAETWLALRARPRPAITVRLDARHQRLPDDVPFVREPLQVVGTTIRSLTGLLLDPAGTPLAGAVVTMAATGAADRTSAAGRFSFPTIPAGPGPVRLNVRAKGRFFTADIDPDSADPVVVRCDLLEA
jgi:hypothetical protein